MMLGPLLLSLLSQAPGDVGRTKVCNGSTPAQCAAVSAVGALKVDASGGTLPVGGVVVLDGGYVLVNQGAAGASAWLTDPSDRSARLLGHVTVDSAPTTAVTGTFWQLTQPVSGTVATTPPSNASTNVAQFGGSNVATGTGTGGVGVPRVTVSSDSFPSSQAVTGTFFQSTQPVSGTVTSNQGTAAANSSKWPVGLTDGTNGPATVKAGSTAAAAADLPVVVALHPTSPLPTGSNTIGIVNAGTGPGTAWKVDLASTGSNATALNTSDAATGATAATVPAKAIYLGVNPQGAVQANATAGQLAGALGNLRRMLFVDPGDPNPFHCIVSAATATAQCQALSTGNRLVITDFALTAGATANGVQIIYGTGAACVTGPTVITPVYNLSINGNFSMPGIRNPAASAASNELCCKPSGATAFGCEIWGYIEP